MKILMASRAIQPIHGYGGMEQYVYNLRKHLIEEGVEVYVVTSLPHIGEPDEKTITIPPRVYGKVQALKYNILCHKMLRYFETLEYDILHGFGITSWLYLKRKKKNKKSVVVQLFGNEVFKKSYKSAFGLLEKYYDEILLKKPSIVCIQRADAIASIGRSNTNDIINLFGVSAEKIFELPNSVDLDLIKTYIANTKITREDLRVQDADIVLINVNRLDYHKGVPVVIDALKILNNELNVKLILIGTGPQEKEIKKHVEKLGLSNKVLRFKNVPEDKLFQLYSLADISVTPGLINEGLYLPILEAMSVGLAVIATNVCPDNFEVVKEGRNGYLFSPNKPEEIADAVLRIYDKMLFKKMGIESKKIVKNYDWSTTARRAIKKYEELADG